MKMERGLLRAGSWIVLTVCVHGVVGACARAPEPQPANAQAAAVAAAAPDAAPRLRPATRGAEVAPSRLAALVTRNLRPEVSLPESLLAARIALWKDLPVGERVARWAALFATRRDNSYCFGPKPGGYVGDSLLVQDFKLDCVSLFYRCTELARAQSPRDAILLALSTRFAGGDPENVVTATGAVDYDDPSHLDYSEDFAATGLWGRDVTREVGDAVPDDAGTSRYPAGTRWYIPSAHAGNARFRDGDLLLFVLDEKHPKALALRRDYGLLVGHQALVDVDGGTVYQIHAAQSPIAGVYDGNRVVRVPLATYLQRVERFKGLMVVRLESATAGLAP